MKLEKEEYRFARQLLEQYNYNLLKKIDIEQDFTNIQATSYDGMPKAKYNIHDKVSENVVRMSENKELLFINKKIKAVRFAVEIVNCDCKKVFHEFYEKNRNMYDIIDEIGMSERTFKRRKKDLIYSVYKEYEKLCGTKLA